MSIGVLLAWLGTTERLPWGDH